MQLAKLGLVLALGGMWIGTATARDVPTATATPQVTLTAEGEYRRQLSEADALFERGDVQAANKAYKSLLADKRFAGLSDKQRMGALLYGATSAFRSDESERARALFERSLLINPTAYAWYMLSIIHLLDSEGTRSAHYLALAVRKDPAQLSDYNEALVPEVLRESTPASPERMELMQALFDTGWDHNGLGASGIWLDLAARQLEQGKTEQAKATVARIDGAMSLARLRVDKRFDALLASMPPLPTPEAGAQARLDQLRALVKREPERLDALISMIGALDILGQWDESLRLSTDALSRIESAAGTDAAFADTTRLNWLKDRRGYALRALGRMDESVAQMKLAASTRESEQANVSQVINLANLYCMLGQPEQALVTLKDLGPAISDYGRMVEASVRLYAASLKQDTRGTKRSLGYLREHRADAAVVYLEALVMAGQLDEAAKELSVQLDDVQHRADALAYVQTFRELDPLPGEVTLRAYRTQWLARADVQAAVQKAGRIGRFELYMGGEDE